MFNYNYIPEHMRGGMKRYIEDGISPGDFLLCILKNDFVHAACRADHMNINSLKGYAMFLFNECPSPAWGSEKEVNEWMESGGLKGLGLMPND
jgi:hypothetical protein